MKAICHLLSAVLIVPPGLAIAGAAEPDAPIVPRGAIKLFNGRDLSGWTTWLVDTKRQDPRGVYSVRDGMLRISGDGFPASGRILLQCEGSEIFFRKTELHPVKGSVRINVPLRIVALGDSITNGIGLAGVTEADTFRDIVRRELTERLGSKVEVVNAGVNGDIVTRAIGRLKADVLDRKPDIVTVMFGGNEAGFYRPETGGFADTPRVGRDEFKAALGKVVDRLRAEGILVVLLTCPPMTDRYWGMHLDAYQKHGINFLVKDYAQTMRDVAAEKGVELIDVYRSFQQDPSTRDYFPDGLHPDARGHRVIANLLVRRLTGIIGGRPPVPEK
jgi:lysophospholipase L1-like esterase